jgi:membrane-bound metal-dependent hydrolase YbcI (DUF457 family)
MSSRLFKFAVVAIVLAVLVHPLVESMDTWDGVGPTNDTELTVVGLVIAIGLILTLRRLIVLTTAAMELMALRLDAPDDPEPVTPPSGLTAFSSSGPPPLLPLRI